MSIMGKYANEVIAGLKNVIATDADGKTMAQDDALGMWVAKARSVEETRGTAFFCGNGASASMAEHISHDCFQNAGLLTYTVSEVSHLTAISNDISFEDVYAYRISKMCDNNDMLIAISSSGNSPNIIKAIKTARDIGMYIVTISGKSADNESRKLGDLNFYVPLDTYGLVESAHATLLHCWLDLYMEKHKGGRH